MCVLEHPYVALFWEISSNAKELLTINLSFPKLQIFNTCKLQLDSQHPTTNIVLSSFSPSSHILDSPFQYQCSIPHSPLVQPMGAERRGAREDRRLPHPQNMCTFWGCWLEHIVSRHYKAGVGASAMSLVFTENRFAETPLPQQATTHIPAHTRTHTHTVYLSCSVGL